MSFTVNAFDHAEWRRLGLAEFADFKESITARNVGENYGEWYFVPDEPLPTGERVIYFGSWGNDNSPGASTYTHATIFDGHDPDDMASFALRVLELESQPEFDEQPEGDEN